MEKSWVERAHLRCEQVLWHASPSRESSSTFYSRLGEACHNDLACLHLLLEE